MSVATCEPSSWRAIVVLGAGRSGTSAITRGLNAIGVDLGNRLRPGSGKNPTGFFEDRDLLRLNKRLKRLLDIRGDSVRLIEPAEWQAAPIAKLRDEAVATIRRRFGNTPLWGYKYGRTLRMLPFWKAVYDTLDLDVAYVLALRNPLSVARSRGKLDPRRGTQEKSDLEWLVNVVPYFRTALERRLVAVDYDLLMAEPRNELARVAKRLKLPGNADMDAGIERFTTDFLKPGMRHSRFTPDDLDQAPNAHPLVRDAYRWLHRLAREDIATDDEGLWRDWARIETEVAALAPVLRHIDRVEGDLRRARLHPAGPFQAIPHLWRRVSKG